MTDIHQPTTGTPKEQTGQRARRHLTGPLKNLRSGNNGNTPESAPERCDHPQNKVMTLFSARDYITGEEFRVGHCYACKLHITLPVPSDAETGKYYPKGYYGSGKRFMGVVESLLDRLHSYRAHQIEQHQKPGKALDIGCGRGLLLNKLKQRGWDPVGTELSEDAAAFARDSLGLTVHTKPLEEIGLPSNEFDLVILWHVLEHVGSPREIIQEVARILKPGGTLLVAVPNFGSWEARWGRDRWFHLDVPRHLTHFTPKTLGDLLASAGMPVTDVNFFSTEYDFFSFVQTFQNKMGLRHNLLYNLLRTRSAKVAGSKGTPTDLLQSAIALITAAPLFAFSLLYAPIIAALGRGGTIAAYATKKREP